MGDPGPAPETISLAHQEDICQPSAVNLHKTQAFSHFRTSGPQDANTQALARREDKGIVDVDDAAAPRQRELPAPDNIFDAALRRPVVEVR